MKQTRRLSRRGLVWAAVPAVVYILAAGCTSPLAEEATASPTAGRSGSTFDTPAMEKETLTPNGTAATPTVTLEISQSPSSSITGDTSYVRPPTNAREGVGRFVVLDYPQIVSAAEGVYLEPDELILGLALGDESRSYPVRMAYFHHIFNDEIGGTPVLVTY